MYYSLLKYTPNGSEVFIDTGKENVALDAAALHLDTTHCRVGILCASDAHDDCYLTHVIADGVVYRLVAVEIEAQS